MVFQFDTLYHMNVLVRVRVRACVHLVKSNICVCISQSAISDAYDKINVFISLKYPPTIERKKYTRSKWNGMRNERGAHKKICIRINSSSIPDDNVIWLDGSCAGFFHFYFPFHPLARLFVHHAFDKSTNFQTIKRASIRAKCMCEVRAYIS